MPEPASSRSLEDILASIRKSLADETVDGLVELSAAAAAAARAQTSPIVKALKFPAVDPAHFAATKSPALSAADVLADDLLRDKLAGALAPDDDDPEAVGDDLSDLLAEPKTSLKASLAASLEAVPRGEAASASASSPDNGALSKIWFLRPGKPDSETGGTRGDGPSLELDPYSDAAPGKGEGSSSSVFSLSPRDLIGDPDAAAKKAPSADAAPLVAPRLDEESVALLHKLRASNAAAIEKIAQSNAEPEFDPDLEPEPEPEVEPEFGTEAGLLAAQAHSEADAIQAPAHAAEQSAEPAARAAETDVVEIAPPAETTAEVPEAPTAFAESAHPLLSRPERATPLFGARPDERRPIVTSGVGHLLRDGVSTPLQPEPVAAEPTVVPVQAVDAMATHEPPPDAVAEVEAVVAPVPAVEVASPAEPGVALEGPVLEAAVAGHPKALEDMIAAVLEPVLQKLIETNIAPMLEVLVRQEVERALKAQPDVR